MSTRPTIRGPLAALRCRAACWPAATSVLFFGAALVTTAAAEGPREAESDRRAVEELRDELTTLRSEVRRLAADLRSASSSADDEATVGESPAADNGKRAEATRGKPSSAARPSPSSASRPNSSSASRPVGSRSRRRPPERQPYYAYPPVWYVWPYYNTPVYAYPYDYHLYNYGVPFQPNSVLVNPYQGQWFSR